MESRTIANAVGDLFEIIYFHQAGRTSVSFYVALNADVLKVNQEIAFHRTERIIPLPAIEALAWGRANLIYVNWRDGAQFQQTAAMGTPAELGRLVDEIVAARPGLPVDEGSRSQTEDKMMLIGMLALLIIFLPVIFYAGAIYLRHAEYIPYAGPSGATYRP